MEEINMFLELSKRADKLGISLEVTDEFIRGGNIPGADGAIVFYTIDELSWFILGYEKAIKSIE